MAPVGRGALATTALRTDLAPLQAEEGTDLFQPREFLAMLARRSWLIVGVLVLGLSITAAITLATPPKYRASASIEVQREETQILQGAEVQPATIADSEHMATQYALLRSRALAERVAEVLDLPSDERYAPQTASRAERLRKATDVIVKNLEVVPVQRSRVIEIRFKSPYPDEASRIATAVADNFIQSTLERRYNATAYARAFLEERLATTKTNLEDAERKLVAYQRQQSIIDLSSVGGSQTGGSLDATSLVALNNSLTQAQDDRITAEQRFIQARDNPATRQTLESKAMEELRAEKSKLESDYGQKLTRFKPDFPEMLEMSAKIAALDKAIASERSNIVGALETEFRAAQAREDALKKRVGELKGEVQDVQDRTIDYNILSREVDTLRTQYNALLQRFKEISIASGIGSSQVSIVDQAQTPRIPFEPNLRSALLRGGFFALLIGIAFAMLLEYIDDTIKTPDDIKSKLGLALIGVVPKVDGKDEIQEELTDTRSSAYEAFASARTALQFSTPLGAPRTLLVTGVRPGEGKTTTSLGLAFAFAGIGKQVLIIDADMRRPSFLADPKASRGLSGVLTNNVALMDNVVDGRAPNIKLLPAGVLPPNPAELLANPRFEQILREAQDHFDIIIVDAPPVLDFADAPLLSSVCEATILVTQAGNVRRPVVLRSIDRLLSANANLAGGVLTKFDVKRTGYSYSYGYAYKYNYAQTGGNTAMAEANRRRRISLFAPDDGDGAST
ncbi:MAG: polysaccharide biosynthesis tyrosine autokinase [Alphaproteobacteria bacterium]|nr:polysaccharide biosynthesis tyrosine autokinase [Alphaproteobacteria bacterium]